MTLYYITITRVEPAGAVYNKDIPATRALLEEAIVEKKWFWSTPILKTSFGIGYEPGMVWDWCSLKDQVKPFPGGANVIKVERLNCSLDEALAAIPERQKGYPLGVPVEFNSIKQHKSKP